MKKIAFLAGAVFVIASPAWADVQSAVRAFDAGLYDVAATEFKRHADDPEAMYRLGVMYADGIWFKRDRAEAEAWLTKAAAQGHEEARRKLAALKGK